MAAMIEPGNCPECPERTACALKITVGKLLNLVETKHTRYYTKFELQDVLQQLREHYAKVTAERSDWQNRILLLALFSPHYLQRVIQAALS
jgi:hypothetical protein